MYETPILIPVGSAQEVILGTILVGFDIDTLLVTGGTDFEDDSLTDVPQS